MTGIKRFFPADYEESRRRFQAMVPELQKRWPQTTLHQHPLSGFPDISIDWITTRGSTPPKTMLVFTTGEHGIEGFVGSAMLELFFQRYLPRLDPDSTGLTLVHMINPWGMKNYRRTNTNNVDLNRNFVWEPEQIDPGFNPAYGKIRNLVEPQGQIGSLFLEKVRFMIGFIKHQAKLGRARLWEAKIFGQYVYQQGIHYGGNQIEEETVLLKTIFHKAFEGCQRLLHLDMHTGYGPRYQMTLVNSPLESRSSEFFKQTFGYPLVAAMTPEAFYEVRGDMIDYVYMLGQKEFPQVALYATSFEFGTFGESHRQRLRSMGAMVRENQLNWNGASSERIAQRIRNEFVESFYPAEKRWREKALADAGQAFEGILRWFGLVGEGIS
jgi:hypothetical protein